MKRQNKKERPPKLECHVLVIIPAWKSSRSGWATGVVRIQLPRRPATRGAIPAFSIVAW